MTELEKIAYAKSFIDKLANGINPIDDSIIPDGDVVNNVRLSRCFFYVSDILRQVVDNGGIAPVVKSAGKLPYSISAEQIAQFEFSESPIPSSEIFKRIIAVGPQEGVGKFPKRNLTRWLLSLGLIEKDVLPTGGKLKRPTAAGEELGITLEERTGQYGKYYVVLYSTDAQHFIIDNIEAVLACGKAPKKISPENIGLPWSDDDEETLVELFNNGTPVSKIAAALKRTPTGIRARLKRLGMQFS